MAKSYWRGPNGTGGEPTSGAFGDAGNWVGGTVPDGDSDVFLAAGDYVVQVRALSGIESLSIGSGVTLDIQRPSEDATAGFGIDGDLVNYGAIRFAGGVINQGVGTTLVNFGLIHGVANLRIPSVGGSLLENFGRLAADEAQGAIDFQIAIHNDVGGEIVASSGIVYLVGSVDNDGLIGAYGGTISFTGFGSYGSSPNFEGDDLRGGRWEALSGGSITLNAGGVVANLFDGADVTLGSVAAFGARQDDDGIVDIAQSLRRVGEGATLRLAENRALDLDRDLVLDGTLTLGGGGSLTTPTLDVGRSGVVSGGGTIRADTFFDGRALVSADGGFATLYLDGDTTFAGRATGGGALVFENGEVRVHDDARISTNRVLFSGASARIDGSLVLKGALLLDGSQLDIGDTLRVGKAASFHDARVTGSADARLVLAAGVDLRGDTEVLVAVQAKGRVLVDGDALFDRGVTGSARFVIDDGSALTFGRAVGAAATIAMNDGAATLRVGDPYAFHAHLLRFGADDQIVLTGVDSTSRLAWKGDADGEGGTLSVFDPDGRITLRFDTGAYLRTGFHLAAEPGDASSLTYTPPAADARAFGADADATLHGWEAIEPLHGAALHLALA